jgi:hypothetical protein
MDLKKETQDKGIAITQNSNLQKIKLTFFFKNHLQSLEALPIELNTKKCLTHPFTWRRR